MSEEALQIAEKRREAKGKGEKESYTYLNAKLQRIARRDKKGFLHDKCKEKRKTKSGKDYISLQKKLEMPGEYFM